MYGKRVYTTIQTLRAQGKGKCEIARVLGIHRNTVTRIFSDLDRGVEGPEVTERPKKLDAHAERIQKWIENEGLTAELIHDRLVQRHSLKHHYATTARYVQSLKPPPEVFVPQHADPGAEGQVDFGYFGKFTEPGTGRCRKTWVFCMTLSNSRYAYYEAVTDQSVRTFLNCHIHAFEYFGGAPRTVKLDNLKSGVLEANLYEPIIQSDYAEMLAHYGSAPVACRPRRPQDKGKVERGIAYVCGNFLPRLQHRDLDRVNIDLLAWTDEVCNRRRHGTTREVPGEAFAARERSALLPLPRQRYTVWTSAPRIVDRMGHVAFASNYYSVPSTLARQQVTLRCNGPLLRVFDTNTQVAQHFVIEGKGRYVTLDEHRPLVKRYKPDSWFDDRAAAIGPQAVLFLEALRAQLPYHWRPRFRGILKLTSRFPASLLERACGRALRYGSLRYRVVKTICEKNLAEPREQVPAKTLGGYGHDLARYDQLTTHQNQPPCRHCKTRSRA